MAIDEMLLGRVGQRLSPPTLRFYQWPATWISLGSAQRAADFDQSALAARGWEIVRRGSGGTGIIHRGQLGYSLILPSEHPLWSGDLGESYRRLSVPLRLAYQTLGVTARAAESTDQPRFRVGAPTYADRSCFGALGPSELVDPGGRKLIGNSQIRKRASALQHGVIQLRGNQSELVEVLADLSGQERAELARFLEAHVGSIETNRGTQLADDEVVDAVATAFAVELGIAFSVGSLDPMERALADELTRTRFRDPEWTFRR